MRIWPSFLLFSLAFGVAIADPVPPSPVLQHYHAYTAALDAGDLVKAESEASHALDASEARDHDGGNTAALALNLATTRLLQNNAQGAMAPAQRAYALAQAGARGVNPQLATLTLGRVELAIGGAAGADHINGVLGGQGLDALPAEDVYAAAMEVGHWQMAQRQYVPAKLSFDAAAAHAAGSLLGEAYGAARAKTWGAAALFVNEITTRQTIRKDIAVQLRTTLNDALSALAPQTDEASGSGITIAQRAYADALAWRSAVLLKAGSDEVTLPEETTSDPVETVAIANSGAPPCIYHTVARPLPAFPTDQERLNRLGVVVVMFRMNEAGSVVDREIAASVGNPTFAQSIERVMSQWTVSKAVDSPANCRAETIFVSVNFGYDQEPPAQVGSHVPQH